MTRISCILVANRGEIVSRVARTASRLGIRTVGVYSDSDAHSLYLDDVDLAVALGDDSAASPYLSIEKIIDACRRTGADAVHPGYGFLAENAEFAQAVIDADLTWIGPTPAAIAAMGGKIGAKEIAAEAGVPVLDSVTVTDDVAASIDAVRALTPPLLVKPSAGGGGKGMVRLDSHDGLERALETARRGAESAFGDGTLFVERYLEGPRHIEVQILGDIDGTVIDVGTRDCSVQRRHQKIIEEAPGLPTHPASLGSEIRAAAVSLAKQIGYVGAGTVEFLAYDGGFAFLEMNTRLQVEHAVTEEVAGVDLVEQQIRIAEGARLPEQLVSATLSGHAIEARVYAEDPARGYLPSPGRVEHWSTPDLAGVRWEVGVEPGSDVSVRFDPMIAKAVAHGPDRATAISLLSQALRRTEVTGISTNIPQLIEILADGEFGCSAVGTDFLDRRSELVGRDADSEQVSLAALAASLHSLLAPARLSPASDLRVQAFAPPGFRNLPSQPIISRYTAGDADVEVALSPQRDGSWMWGSEVVRVSRLTDDKIALAVDGVRRSFAVTAGDPTIVRTPDGVVTLHQVASVGSDTDEGIAGSIAAPLPGVVVSIEVGVGDSVQADQTLVVLEAMKMEHKLTAGGAGVVKEILVGVGDSVDYQAALIVVEES